MALKKSHNTFFSNYRKKLWESNKKTIGIKKKLLFEKKVHPPNRQSKKTYVHFPWDSQGSFKNIFSISLLSFCLDPTWFTKIISQSFFDVLGFLSAWLPCVSLGCYAFFLQESLEKFSLLWKNSLTFLSLMNKNNRWRNTLRKKENGKDLPYLDNLLRRGRKIVRRQKLLEVPGKIRV